MRRGGHAEALAPPCWAGVRIRISKVAGDEPQLPPLLRISALPRIGRMCRAAGDRLRRIQRGCRCAFSSIQSFSFNLVVLVEGRLACGELHFHLQSQRFRTARTLWGSAPEARGLQTTTFGRATGLWMTVQLFENCPQGCQGCDGTLHAPRRTAVGGIRLTRRWRFPGD